jgi:hypothetical protein
MWPSSYQCITAIMVSWVWHYIVTKVLCFVDCASLNNLANKTNLVHNLFLVYLPISTSFGRLWAHHQEKQLCLCDTCFLLFCMNDCLHTRQSSIQNKKYQVSHKYGYSSWWCAHIRQKHVEKINKHTKKNCAPIWRYFQDCRAISHN